MAFDFKKEYKEFYLPKRKPEIIEVPPYELCCRSRQRRPE